MPRQKAVRQAGSSLARAGGVAVDRRATLPPPPWTVEPVAGSVLAGGWVWSSGGGTVDEAP
eukprot:12565569-Alexandrium_andersonii.AAC.1